MHCQPIRIAAYVFLAFVLNNIDSAQAQLGQPRRVFDETLGGGTYASPEEPADEAREYSLPKGRTLVVGFSASRARYVELTGGGLSPNEIAEFFSRMSPRIHGRKHRGDKWGLDKERQAFFPPLGRFLPRHIFEPTHIESGVGRSAGYEVTEVYYDGQLIDRGVTNAWDYEYGATRIGGIHHDYQAARGVWRACLERGDLNAFAQFDVTFDSDAALPSARSVLLADAEAFWMLTLTRLVEQRIDLPTPTTEWRFNDIEYSRALAAVVDQERLALWLERQYLVGLAAAVDNSNVPIASLSNWFARPTRETVTAILLRDLLKQPTTIKRRRLAMLQQFGTAAAIPSLERIARGGELGESATAVIEDIRNR